MSRLIDADALEEGKFHSIENWTPIEIASWQWGWNDAIDAIIDNAPTVDAVKVVRCKDCVLFEPNTFPIRSGHPCCRVGLEPDDFCSWAETEYEVEDE